MRTVTPNKNSLNQAWFRKERPGTLALPKRGLVIGKFYPPHKGHSYLIETALEHTDEVDVLVCDHPNYRIPADQRVKWLKALHPKASVYKIRDIEKDDDSEAWAEHTIRFLGYAPHVVFTSEDYGDTYAAYLGAKHHLVDKKRERVPINASKIRPDVLSSWEFLSATVRQQYAIRICVLGAESTGTTTLAQALAKKYGAPWVPEYGRYYTESLLTTVHTWQTDDFVHIARMQQKWERQLAGESNGLVVCDTNAFATRLWHERYMGCMSRQVDKIAAKDKVDLYIITNVDIPFVQDGLRDGEHIRHKMHERFLEEVTLTQIPFTVASGSVKQRLALASKEIDKILNKKVIV